MVIYEGQGRVAPAPVKIKLAPADIRLAIAESRRRNEMRRYGDRKDRWGRGLTGQVVIPNVGVVDDSIAPIVAGIVGETAVSFALNSRIPGLSCAPNLEVRRGGDGGIDLSVFGVGVDVKTRLRDYASFLVRSTTNRGELATWSCKAFVFVDWNRSLVANIRGWMWSRDVRRSPIVDALRGDHKNYSIAPNELLPLNRLVDYLKSRNDASN